MRAELDTEHKRRTLGIGLPKRYRVVLTIYNILCGDSKREDVFAVALERGFLGFIIKGNKALDSC
jgi:hypothetical protein